MPAAVVRAAVPGMVIANTAQATYRAYGSDITITSPAATLITQWPRTAASVELMQYAPGMSGAEMVSIPLTGYDPDGTGGGTPQQIASIHPAGSPAPIDLARSVPLVGASIYHQGEPIFLRVADPDQNSDPATAQHVYAQVATTLSADTELLLLSETGPNTGIFAGYIQTEGNVPVQPNNGVLNVGVAEQLAVYYTDADDASDSVTAQALVDPYGRVFDSATGQPVDGVQLTLVDTVSGSAATVYGDDGHSAFPSTITSGGTFTDSSGKIYAFGPGAYRFPFVPAGRYRLTAVPPAGYAAPSTVAEAALQSLPGAPYAVDTPGSFGEIFVLNPGPAVRLDIPVDPTGVGLWLQKTVNRDIAAVGDFVQYAVSVENRSGGPAAIVAAIDRLPPGFRLRPGSVRVDGIAAADPRISADGRELVFELGDVADGRTVELRYVAEISAGAKPGKAENRIRARASGGLSSNSAIATLTIREELFRSKNMIVGRVVADNCDDDPAVGDDGVAGVRVYLEDGTYVITDEQGRYHFEGVSSAAHVVQVDLATIPAAFEFSACGENDRQAGTPFSRFVDLHGGTLWREDFHLQTKQPPAGQAVVKMTCGLEQNTVHYQAEVAVRRVPVHNARLSVILPEGSRYLAGSSLLDGNAPVEPRQIGDTLIFHLADALPDQTHRLGFAMVLDETVAPGRMHTRALLTFDTPALKNQRSGMIDTVLALDRRTIRQAAPAITVRPKFDSLSAELAPSDRRMLDELADRLRSHEIDHVVVTGHTDNRLIRSGRREQFPDNRALSLSRARTVARYLADRLNLPDSRITISGMGADQPIAGNDTEAGRALNRRVEVKVLSATVKLVQDIASIKCEDQVTADTRGAVAMQPRESAESAEESPSVQKFEDIDINLLQPGLAWLMPAADFYPHIPSVKLAVQHAPGQTVDLMLDGQPVSALNYDGAAKNRDGTIQVGFWRGVDIHEGDNRFVAVCRDGSGRETGRIERIVHYSSPPVNVQWIPEQSQLAADGKSIPAIAVRLTDKDGRPARYGLFGDYTVQPPFQAYAPKERLDRDVLTRIQEVKTRYKVGRDGIARIRLEPTTRSGLAIVQIPLADKVHEVRVWIKPEPRDWILVGLAEGTAGYNTVSGNLENLAASGRQEDFYRDGRLAFFAKGRVKGRWLLTMAYDSSRGHKDLDNRLFQTIDPDTYFTLYGDAAQQQYEASSVRKLYLKIERDQFYALFGDFDTGLTVTELSRYSRRFNGFKSAYEGERFGYTAFAADTGQTFFKDEIMGNGTSGLYRLSRQDIAPNSETVVIETRDRFHSENILATRRLTRFVDYTIDYDGGTLFFKMPVYSRDENFNPVYIVAEYEREGGHETAYTYGGRGSVALADGKVRVGTTFIHEGPENGDSRLVGLDTRIDLGDGLQVKAEAATANGEDLDGGSSGQAYLAEVSKQSADLDARIYLREQGSGFGLGQQNGSEAEMRKMGAEGAWRLKENWKLSGELYRQSNLATNAQRDLGEARVTFNQPAYTLYSGWRSAADRYADGQNEHTNQMIVGGSRRFMDNRFQARFSHEQSVGAGDESADFPTRSILGVDFRVSEPITLFAEHEITRGADEDTQSSRLGAKASAWSGGRIGSSVGRQITENSQRLFASLGLNQTWRISDHWSVDGGLDRTQTMHHHQTARSVNPGVPAAAGSQEDFTAVSLGAGYRADLWAWNIRLESRDSESEAKLSLITGIAGEVRRGLALSAGLQLFGAETEAGSDSLQGDLRFNMACRPRNTRWIVLDRLEYTFEDLGDLDGDSQARRIINNLNADYKPHQGLQISMQYAAKYVFQTFDDDGYSGYTDLTGLEARYDLTPQWDLGLHGGVLHSWNAGQLDYRSGLSLGHALVRNMWVCLGYNFSGFRDSDFSGADFTAAGPYLKFRFKFDQQSVRDMVDWFSAKRGA